MKTFLLISFFAIASCLNGDRFNDIITTERYRPDWKDLDKRPLPGWYDKSKIGIFIHWGIYSVPGIGSEWFWKFWKEGKYEFDDFMRHNYPPKFTYQDFAPKFTGKLFNASHWAETIKTSGAKYVVLTSKHHDGYALFPSSRSFSWNSVDTGPHRDIVRELSHAVRRNNMRFGIYYSLMEWFNPLYLADKQKGFSTNNYIQTKMWPDIQQLVNDYNPSVIWADGDWEAYDTYWMSKELLAWLYNYSPVKDEVVVNDRWGVGTPCHHGDFHNCKDHYNPGVLGNHKWENAFPLDRRSWGHRKSLPIEDILSIEELLKEVVTTVSCGGNVLINIGPTQEGTIIPIFQERLKSLGEWLKVNGRAIYETSPWHSQNDSFNGNVWYTCRTKYNEKNPVSKPDTKSHVKEINAIFLQWPMDNILRIRDITEYVDKYSKFHFIGYHYELKREVNAEITEIKLPPQHLIQSKDAWTIQFTMVLNHNSADDHRE